MKKKIAIIGAGIAGLTLGNFLQKNSNYEFTIYEKREALNLDEGFGIQLAVNSISILNQIGFSELNKSDFFNPKAIDFYSNQNKICDLDLTQFNAELAKYTTLKRSSLIKFLKDKLFSNVFMFNKIIKTVEYKNSKIRISFADEHIDEIDYLVVSDGVFSITKTVIENKKFKINFHKTFATRITINKDKLKILNKENISLFMCERAHLVFYPVNNDHFNFVTTVRSRNINSDDTKKALLSKILKQNNLNILSEKDLSFWPIYTSPKPTISKYNNIFYLGDAFCTLLPTMAQGASQSIEGAKELFTIFEKNNKDKQDLFFSNRLERIEMIRKRSSFNFFVFHLSNFFLIRIRNFFLRKLIYNKKFINIFLERVFSKQFLS